MKNIFIFLFLIVTFLSSSVLSQALSGDKLIKPTGGDYTTLAAAVADLNTNGANGTVNFILDADTLREASFTFSANLSAVNNVVIKPAPGRNVVLIVSASASVGNGPFMIGFTKGFVTFDGSNNGTNSRNLIVTTEQITPVVDVPFTVNHGDADSVVLKNLIIKNIFEGQTNFRYGAVINDIGGVTGFRVENCQVGTATRPIRRDAFAPWGASSVANQFSIINNEVYCGTRGVATLYLFDSEIIGNTFNILPTTAGATDSYNHGIYITGSVGRLKIHENKINCLEKTSNATAYLIGIAFAGNGNAPADVISIFNNMINIGAVDETRSTYGIGFRSAQVMGNIKAYYNTIVINNNASTLTSYAIGNHTNGTGSVNIDLKNNILINNHSGNTGSSAIGLVPVTSVLTSNYNVLVSNQNLVNYQGTLYANLPAWQAANQDLNSVSKVVNFVSGTDLHLAGTSIGDVDLVGTPIDSITTDIDGTIRSLTAPIKGAHEAQLPAGLSGTYYVGAPGTGPGGSNPLFNSFKSACDSLNHGNVTGNCTFYITSNLVEPKNVGLGLNTNGFTITFKPMAGTVDTILFTQTADNPGVSGAFVIGAPDLTVTSATNYGLVTTENIIIDGSNTADGNSRDLIFLTNTGISSNTYPVRPFGDVNNTVIKNIKVATQQSTSYGMVISVRNANSTNYVPDNITVENCEITNVVGGTAQGLAISNSGTPTEFPSGIVFKNNTINAKTRGIFLNYAGNTDVYGNEISINQTLTGYMSYGIWGYVIGDSTKIINIYKNRIKLLSSANANSGSYGIIGIEAASKGIYNIYNNMIYGFDATSTTVNPNINMIGIRNVTAAVTTNINFNSIYLPNVNLVPGTGVVNYSGIYISNGINNVSNNIVVSDETDFASYCIYRTGTNGTLISNNNDFFVANSTVGNVGYFNNAPTPTLQNWQTASSQDANSISANPVFVSTTDLHLLNNQSPVVGKGVKIFGITDDFDGALRDSIPEIGCHEFPGHIPVELISFKAASNGNDVVLTWETASEVNSSQFIVERKSMSSNWILVAELTAAGNSTQNISYNFTDRNINSGKYSYRLKQVDFDGTYSYSQEIEVLVDVPADYELSQNYPNPFNPSTTIKYAIPQESKVTLEIYSTLGELVTTLVNDLQPAGKYSILFDGSKLASGTYIYRLVSNETVIAKKMLLIK